MTDIRNELKPCPFCKGEPKLSLVTPAGWNNIYCTSCESSVVRRGVEETTEAWNTRAHDIEGLIAEIERLKSSYDADATRNILAERRNSGLDDAIEILRKYGKE